MMEFVNGKDQLSHIWNGKQKMVETTNKIIYVYIYMYMYLWWFMMSLRPCPRPAAHLWGRRWPLHQRRATSPGDMTCHRWKRQSYDWHLEIPGLICFHIYIYIYIYIYTYIYIYIYIYMFIWYFIEIAKTSRDSDKSYELRHSSVLERPASVSFLHSMRRGRFILYIYIYIHM